MPNSIVPVISVVCASYARRIAITQPCRTGLRSISVHGEQASLQPQEIER